MSKRQSFFVARDEIDAWMPEICRRGAELTEAEEKGRSGFLVTFAT